jgi:two-component system response regulator PilR (NtrC family)
MNRKAVLIVDDEADIRELLVLTLSRMGVDADTASSIKEAEEALKSKQYDLALTDMRLPDGDGLMVLRHIAEHYGNTPVAVITAFGSTENAVAALKAGAFDYLAKPIKLEQLRPLVMSALKLPKPTQARRTAIGEAAPGVPRLLGESPAIQRARDMIGKLARSQAPVYITGESGSGKEVAARLIHSGSSRADAPFVAVNCGAIPENLMESEFFGYKKGAFTGADADKMGYLKAAERGTLFLDEVGDLPLAMQVKLLRVIQEKKVRRVGDTQEDAIDVRIISATHRSLSEQVEAGEFRQDLFYRLNVIELKMPSLREIPEDIPVMVEQVVERLARQGANPAAPSISEEAMLALRRYDFPGNVRELENILERALALCSDNKILESDLYLTQATSRDKVAPLDGALGTRGLPLHDFLDQIEREAITKALEATRFNKTAAAKLLGITFRSLRYRLDRLGID